MPCFRSSASSGEQYAALRTGTKALKATQAYPYNFCRFVATESGKVLEPWLSIEGILLQLSRSPVTYVSRCIWQLGLKVQDPNPRAIQGFLPSRWSHFQSGCQTYFAATHPGPHRGLQCSHQVYSTSVLNAHSCRICSCCGRMRIWNLGPYQQTGLETHLCYHGLFKRHTCTAILQLRSP